MSFASVEADVAAPASDVFRVLSQPDFQHGLLGGEPNSLPLADRGIVVWDKRGSATGRVWDLEGGSARVRLSLHRRVPVLLTPVAAIFSPVRRRVTRQLQALTDQLAASPPATRPEPIP